MNISTITGAATIVIAIVVAFLIEILKVKKSFSIKSINLSTLLLGLIGGFIYMLIFKAPFPEAVTVGISGGLASTGVYETLVKETVVYDNQKTKTH